VQSILHTCADTDGSIKQKTLDGRFLKIPINEIITYVLCTCTYSYLRVSMQAFLCENNSWGRNANNKQPHQQQRGPIVKIQHPISSLSDKSTKTNHPISIQVILIAKSIKYCSLLPPGANCGRRDHTAGSRARTPSHAWKPVFTLT
jgi:hypothetical protein